MKAQLDTTPLWIAEGPQAARQPRGERLCDPDDEVLPGVISIGTVKLSLDPCPLLETPDRFEPLHRLTLVTPDKLIAQYGVHILW